MFRNIYTNLIPSVIEGVIMVRQVEKQAPLWLRNKIKKLSIQERHSLIKFKNNTRETKMIKHAQRRGIYVIYKGKKCIYVGKVKDSKNRKDGKMRTLSDRLYDLATGGSHTLVKRHKTNLKDLKNYSVRMIACRPKDKRSLLEHYAIAVLRPVHYEDDGCMD
jgi:hypothetical protein